MGNPLKVTEDAIEIEDKSDTLNAILKNSHPIYL
jgi:hypothetical protein